MPARRTQVYLTDQQRSGIDRVADEQGVTMAEVIRRALDAYLAATTPDSSTILPLTFGSIPDMQSPDRSEWSRG